MRRFPVLAGLFVATFAAAVAARADQYAAFSKTRYYSPNRRFFVEVTESKRATLYRNGWALRRVWSRTLDELPGDVIVSADGSRVALVDFYYGNRREAAATVVAVLDARGNRIAGHRLGDLADLARVFQTVSTAHWYSSARVSPDGRFLEIETVVLKNDPKECSAGRAAAPARSEECWEVMPHRRLRFDLTSGGLAERRDLTSR